MNAPQIVLIPSSDRVAGGEETSLASKNPATQVARPSPPTPYRWRIRLEQLNESHAAALARHGRHPATWAYLTNGPFQDFIDARDWIRAALKEFEQGKRIPYAILDAASGEPIGSTSLLALSPQHKRVEIGSTWLSPAYAGRGYNTESKYLLLHHAFHSLQANRIEIKTDARNLRSQRTLEKIGAMREGLLRAHMIMPDGFVRDSLYYSVIWQDWPTVRQNIMDILKTGARPANPCPPGEFGAAAPGEGKSTSKELAGSRAGAALDSGKNSATTSQKHQL